MSESNPSLRRFADTPPQNKEFPSKITVRVLFGSETGTAEDLAQHAAEALNDAGGSIASLSTLDEYDLYRLPEHAREGHIFVFVVSTCGDGEVPRNMYSFWTFLRRADLPPDVLKQLQFSVFGLGDRSYVKYNACARKLYARLVQLGAQSLLPLSLGDDNADGGYDVEFVRWLNLLIDTLCPEKQIESDEILSSPSLRPARFKVDLLGRSSLSSTCDSWSKSQAPDNTGDSYVIANDVITDSSFLSDNREVRHVALDISHIPKSRGFLNYEPGDIVHILPRNRPSAVDAFLKLMNLEGGDLVNVCDTELESALIYGRIQLNIRTPCSVWELVSAQFDLWCTPRRRFFQQLAHYAKNPAEHEKLIELGSAKGLENLTQYVHREKRTLLMVLRDFPSARPPLTRLIELIPRIRSRAFSLASSPGAHPGVVHVCAAMVRYTTPLRFARVGLCSSFLERLEVGNVVPVFLERGSALRFHQNSPAILIGAGTGVAPMRSFVSSCMDDGVERILIYGCRNEHGDFLYKEEWDRWISNGVLHDVVAAFSRAGPAKVYVQHMLLQMGERIWRMISEMNSRVYIAGAAGGMPKGVREALVTVCRTIGGLGDGAEQFVRRLEVQRRIQMECW